MPSAYLNLPIRSHAEVLAEKRESIRQEMMNATSGAAQEKADELEFFSDKMAELLQLFYRRIYNSEAALNCIALLEDGIADLRGDMRDIRENERNNR